MCIAANMPSLRPATSMAGPPIHVAMKTAPAIGSMVTSPSSSFLSFLGRGAGDSRRVLTFDPMWLLPRLELRCVFSDTCDCILELETQETGLGTGESTVGDIFPESLDV